MVPNTNIPYREIVTNRTFMANDVMKNKHFKEFQLSGFREEKEMSNTPRTINCHDECTRRFHLSSFYGWFVDSTLKGNSVVTLFFCEYIFTLNDCECDV